MARRENALMMDTPEIAKASSSRLLFSKLRL